MQKKNQILLWMLISMVIGYLPWFNFSAVLKFIASEYHFTATQTGVILSAFQAGYVIVVIFTGWLADKIGAKMVLGGATLLTAIFSTIFPFLAHGFISVLILRLITGAACGAIYAPGMALLSNWFPPSQRGHALGAYTGALVAAYAGGYFIAGPVAASSGWRAGMLATSIPVFVAFIIIFFFVQEKPKEPALQFDGAGTTAGAQPCPQGGKGGPILISVSYMGHMWELYTFWGWIGPFMVAASTAVGYSAEKGAILGTKLAALIILVGAPATWLWGLAADKIGRTKAITIAATLSLFAEFFFGFLYGQALALVVVAGLWIGFWTIADSAIFKAGLVDMVTPKIRATSLGIQSGIGFTMTIIGPLVFGKILQYYNGPGNPVAAKIWGPSFVAVGVVALLAPITCLILRRHPQSIFMCGGKR